LLASTETVFKGLHRHQLRTQINIQILRLPVEMLSNHERKKKKQKIAPLLPDKIKLCDAQPLLIGQVHEAVLHLRMLTLTPSNLDNQCPVRQSQE
jgi:hypothetical protein